MTKETQFSVTAPDDDGVIQSVTVSKEIWWPKIRAWKEMAEGMKAHCLKNLTASVEHEAPLAEMRVQLRTSRKKLDERRLAGSKPFRDASSFLNDQFKRVDADLEAAQAHVDRCIRAVLADKEAKQAEERRKREEAHRKDMARLQKEASERIDAQGQQQEEFEPAEITVAPVKQAVESSIARVDTKVIREVVIDDEAKLPRKYLVPDRQRIKMDALNGESIPGVRVAERDALTSRRL